MRRIRVFRIRAQYACTSLVLLVRGDDPKDAKRRAAWYQKGAVAYCVLGELNAMDPSVLAVAL